MEKTTTLNLRVNPDVKRRAEEVLSQLGIPFDVTLPKVPISVNTDLMTIDEIHAKLKEGYNDIEKGNVQDASDAFQRFRKTHE